MSKGSEQAIVISVCVVLFVTIVFWTDWSGAWEQYKQAVKYYMGCR